MVGERGNGGGAGGWGRREEARGDGSGRRNGGWGGFRGVWDQVIPPESRKSELGPVQGLNRQRSGVRSNGGPDNNIPLSPRSRGPNCQREEGRQGHDGCRGKLVLFLELPRNRKALLLQGAPLVQDLRGTHRGRPWNPRLPLPGLFLGF